MRPVWFLAEERTECEACPVLVEPGEPAAWIPQEGITACHDCADLCEITEVAVRA